MECAGWMNFILRRDEIGLWLYILYHDCLVTQWVRASESILLVSNARDIPGPAQQSLITHAYYVLLDIKQSTLWSTATRLDGCTAIGINPGHAGFILGNMKIYLYVLSFLNTEMAQLKSCLMVDKTLFMLHSQYYGSWWPGDANKSDPKYSGFSTRRAKLKWTKMQTLLFFSLQDGLWYKYNMCAQCFINSAFVCVSCSQGIQ